jgi:hypothetical protein
MAVAVELSREEQERYQRSHRWGAILGAALIAGGIIWLWPSGNPWTSFARPSGAFIMGRPVSFEENTTLFSLEAMPAHLAHFGVAILYAAILLFAVFRLHSWRALLVGVLVGIGLYFVNLLAFWAFAPQFVVGRWEINVIIAHVLFGGIAAGVIRGFLRPPMRLDESKPNPGPKYP